MSDTTLVWYASYGSNVAPTRFRFYLQGGTAPGSRRAVPGARDATPPRENRLATLPHPMFFAGSSPRWDGGGAAFVDPGQSGRAHSRAYLVTEQQFVDVLRQENDCADLVCDVAGLVSAGDTLVSPSTPYGRVLAGRWVDDRPCLTFTCPDPTAMRCNAPSSPYLATIAAGLIAGGELERDEIVTYLASAPGIADRRSTAELTRLVDAAHPSAKSWLPMSES